MAGGFKPNQRGIDQMFSSLQREFDRRGPLRVNVAADDSGAFVRSPDGGTTHNTYNGPVVINTGNGVQVALNAQNVSQIQGDSRPVPDEFAQLAEVLGELLPQLPEHPLSAEDRETVDQAAREALEEMTQEAPRPPVIRRSVAAVRGALSSLALAAGAGATGAVTAESQQWAEGAIHALGSALG